MIEKEQQILKFQKRKEEKLIAKVKQKISRAITVQEAVLGKRTIRYHFNYFAFLGHQYYFNPISE